MERFNHSVQRERERERESESERNKYMLTMLDARLST